MLKQLKMENEILLIIGSVLETMDHAHTTFFENHWLQALYAWVGYNGWLLAGSASKYDLDKSGWLNGKELLYYWRVNRLAIFVSLWLIPAGVLLAKPLWSFAFPSVPFFDYSYMIGGVFVPIVQHLLRKKFNGK